MEKERHRDRENERKFDFAFDCVFVRFFFFGYFVWFSFSCKKTQKAQEKWKIEHDDETDAECRFTTETICLRVRPFVFNSKLQFENRQFIIYVVKWCTMWSVRFWRIERNLTEKCLKRCLRAFQIKIKHSVSNMVDNFLERPFEPNQTAPTATINTVQCCDDESMSSMSRQMCAKALTRPRTRWMGKQSARDRWK